MKLKFAVIGCGRIGKRHIEHINNRAELIAICDSSEEILTNCSVSKSVLKFNNIDALLNAKIDIDAVSICTPNGLHASQTIKCLEAGYDVLCEKPMATSVSDCKKMIEASEKSNKRLFIVKQNRYNPPVVALKKIIDTQKLGKIYSLQLNCFWNRNENYYNNSWKGTRALDGGILYTQFSHFIDLLCWMIGDVSKINSILSNQSNRTDIEFEDTVLALCQFKNEAVGSLNFTINSFEKNMEGSLTVFGEKGTVKIGGQYLNKLEYYNIEGIDEIVLEKGSTSNNYGDYEGSMSNHDKVYENFVDVLQNGGKIATSGYEGMKTVELIEKIYSAKS